MSEPCRNDPTLYTLPALGVCPANVSVRCEGCNGDQTLNPEVAELRQQLREARTLLVESDSYLSLVVHRYPTGIPEDMRREMDDVVRRIRREFS